MTFWTYFFIISGVVFLTMQFARLIDCIERPESHKAQHQTHDPS